MGLLGTLSRDPVKSTAAWADMVFKKSTKKNWENARLNKKNILLTMANSRMGTLDTVIQGIENEEITRLSELCVAMLVSEAASINPSDIPHMQRKSEQYLLKSGIPEEFV